jgi:hypothetical protein
MRRTLITVATVISALAASSATAVAQQPADPRASCVAVITSYEASQLAPGSVGEEVSRLASSPGLGSTLVSPLAHKHLGSIETCRQAEG